MALSAMYFGFSEIFVIFCHVSNHPYPEYLHTSFEPDVSLHLPNACLSSICPFLFALIKPDSVSVTN